MSRIGRTARVYLDSAQLLHYRVHQRVKSVTTYITAVAERHKPLPWWSSFFFFFNSPPLVLSHNVGWVLRYEKRQKVFCATGARARRLSGFIWPGVFWLLLERHMCTFLVWSDYLWSQLYSSATIAKVPVVGAAQCDKSGKMMVSEAPLNIIRRW